MAGIALVLVAPLAAGCALAIILADGFPVLFRQQRIGRQGKPFTLYKLRSMRPDNSGPLVTASNDSRVSSVGKVLRRFKLDEIPQLWNVLLGDMSLVGPRPEVPRYVDLSEPRWQRVLSVRPGLTDPVTLELRNEEEVLAAMPGDPEDNYKHKLLPGKLERSATYLARRTWWTDIRVLCNTVASFVSPGRSASPPTSP